MSTWFQPSEECGRSVTQPIKPVFFLLRERDCLCSELARYLGGDFVHSYGVGYTPQRETRHISWCFPPDAAFILLGCRKQGKRAEERRENHVNVVWLGKKFPEDDSLANRYIRLLLTSLAKANLYIHPLIYICSLCSPKQIIYNFSSKLPV